jgi:hypothetical protein
MKALSKDIVEGKQCEITGHLVSNEHLMGRSLMIDLNAPKGKGFRYVDHRTIQYIIFKNVKYTLGKRDAGLEDIPLKRSHDEAHFDGSKLGIDNWFSSIQYYKVKQILDGENCLVESNKSEIKLSRDIMEYEMFSGMISDKEEKITRTQIAEKLIEAKDTVLTVTFNKKVDDKHVMELLATVTASDQKNADKLKKVAKDMTTGKEMEMTCHLVSTEGKLGRLNCLDLNVPAPMNFRMIDLRTVHSLTLKNVKYILK